jgi:transketolase
VRNKFAETFYELGKADQRLCVIVADISPAGSIAKFRSEFPDRFVNTGVAEQVMIGLAAGMAQRGLRPFAYTIATFALYRPFEMIRDDLCYQNLPVTVVGIGGGVTYSTLGATHHAQEDISIACSLPNMNVIAPCDPAETELATRWCAIQEIGPVYLRLGKAGEPNLTGNAIEKFAFGKLRYIFKGTDICVIAYGTIMRLASAVGESLQEQGLSVSLVSAHTLKPLDVDGLVGMLSTHREVVVIEEMSPQGSLGTKIKALAFECGATCNLHCFSLKDRFIHVYGSHEDLLSAHGLSLKAIVHSVEKNLNW